MTITKATTIDGKPSLIIACDSEAERDAWYFALEKGRPVPVVHLLHHGRTVCGMLGVPAEWPEGHRWVRRGEEDKVTCEGCK